MDIQIKGQPRRARYKNSEEVQQWLFGLGYEWNGGKVLQHLDAYWVFTNRGGYLTFDPDEEYDGDLKLSFMPVAKPVQPHPYQPIIDKLTEAKTEGWEKAVSWLGNVSLEKVKVMRLGFRGDITELYNAFIWSQTPQRHNFWSKQREGLI